VRIRDIAPPAVLRMNRSRAAAPMPGTGGGFSAARWTLDAAGELLTRAARPASRASAPARLAKGLRMMRWVAAWTSWLPVEQIFFFQGGDGERRMEFGACVAAREFAGYCFGTMQRGTHRQWSPGRSGSRSSFQHERRSVGRAGAQCRRGEDQERPSTAPVRRIALRRCRHSVR